MINVEEQLKKADRLKKELPKDKKFEIIGIGKFNIDEPNSKIYLEISGERREGPYNEKREFGVLTSSWVNNEPESLIEGANRHLKENSLYFGDYKYTPIMELTKKEGIKSLFSIQNFSNEEITGILYKINQ